MDFNHPDRPLTILMKSFSPYVNPCAVATHIDRKRCKFPGMDVELLDYMLKFLNITFERVAVTEAVFNSWGGSWGKTNENGTGLDGILGKIQNGEYDMPGIWYGMTKPRAKYIAYSYPIQYTRPLGFLLQQPTEVMGMDASALLYKVFSPVIWAVVGALFVGFIFLLFIAPNLKSWSHGREFRSIRDLDYEGVWGTVCMALHQYHGNVSTGTVFGNMAMIACGFFFLFVSTLYEGILVGTLMSKSDQVPFNSLVGLADQVMRGNYRLIGDAGAGNAFFWDMVTKPETVGHKALNASIEKKGIIIEPDLEKIMDMIQADPKLVWPGQDKLSGTHWAKKRCGVIFLEDTEATFGIPAGFVFAQDSPWLNVFDPLLRTTAAYVKHLEEKYIKQELETDRAECKVDLQREGDPLTLRNMFGIIVVSCLMFGASLIALFAEIGMQRFKSRLLKRVHERMPGIKSKALTIGKLQASLVEAREKSASMKGEEDVNGLSYSNQYSNQYSDYGKTSGLNPTMGSYRNYRNRLMTDYAFKPKRNSNTGFFYD